MALSRYLEQILTSMTPKRESKYSPKRRLAFRKAQETVLIVCEGEKSEPIYFNELCKKLGITSRYIHPVKIVGLGGVPLTVVNKAIELKKERGREARKNNGVKYDQVWAVFDRNGHANIEQAKTIANANGVKVAFSNPCFEFWYILHFECSSRQYANCTEAIRCLKGHIKRDYEKGSLPFEVEYNSVIEDALAHAKWLKEQGHINPYTDVDLLVQSLVSIAVEFGRVPSQ
jgi:hypothetical protein